ncbi:MAG: hypothetical protein FWB90_02120 [Fibromonadales bacterium]|nr:hypothetical protein [Fibromonadales bacterium]
MRLIWLAIVFIGVAVLGCSDGKLNLMLVIWADHESEPSSASPYVPPSSSSVEPPSSSSIYYPSSSEEPQSSSSSEEEPPSSSSVEPPSSSSEEPPPVSSSRGERPERSSGSKTNKDGEEYVDYPILEEGQEGVVKVAENAITRYWDGCKPTCSWIQNIGNAAGEIPNPLVMSKTCDINGKEQPLFYLSPDNYNPPYHVGYLGTPDAFDQGNRTIEWPISQTYKDWYKDDPNPPTGKLAGGFNCLDQIPYAVNDTLAYAFAATSEGICGSCFMLQFTGTWGNTDGGEGPGRVTHKALKGKTLIVMASNTGVGTNRYDIMIPGGGMGACKSLHTQLGYADMLEVGAVMGGLLQECTDGTRDYPYAHRRGGLTPIDRATLDETQDCLRAKCNRVFDKPGVAQSLLKGCLWHADWFMAADNPTALVKKLDKCPKYLEDRYKSNVTTSLPRRSDHPELTNPSCMIDGIPCPP